MNTEELLRFIKAEADNWENNWRASIHKYIQCQKFAKHIQKKVQWKSITNLKKIIKQCMFLNGYEIVCRHNYMFYKLDRIDQLKPRVEKLVNELIQDNVKTILIMDFYKKLFGSETYFNVELHYVKKILADMGHQPRYKSTYIRFNSFK